MLARSRPVYRVVVFCTALAVTLSLVLLGGGTRVHANPSSSVIVDTAPPGVQQLQYETGFTFTVPDGLKEDRRNDGEVQYEGKDLFIAIQAIAGLDNAMQLAIRRLQSIDKNLKAPEVKNLQDEGFKVRAVTGLTAIQGQSLQFMVFCFESNKKTLRMVIVGSDLKNSGTAKSLVQSVKGRGE